MVPVWSFLQLLNFNSKPAEKDEDDEDLSDSEDSVYSGLEDSGSDSEEEDVEEGSDNDDNEESPSQQVVLNVYISLTVDWLDVARLFSLYLSLFS